MRERPVGALSEHDFAGLARYRGGETTVGQVVKKPSELLCRGR